MAVTTARRITSTPRTIRDPKVRRAWQEHAHQAGEIVTAWNDLQAGCFIIFYVVSEAKAHNSWGIALAIWHSVASDSTQREMMLGAAQESLSDKSRVLAHIKWLKNTADKLSKFRNDPAHTPISFMLTNKRGN